MVTVQWEGPTRTQTQLPRRRHALKHKETSFVFGSCLLLHTKSRSVIGVAPLFMLSLLDSRAICDFRGGESIGPD